MRTLPVLALLALAATASAAPGTYVVQLNSESDPDVVMRFHGLGALSHPNNGRAVWRRALKGWAGPLNAAQLARLQTDTRVLSVETNAPFQLFAQTIPTGVKRVGCQSNAAWLASAVTPINADIAIIDSGIQLNHPDLNVVENVTFVAGTATGADDNGHGTHVAGIAAALNNTIGVVGVAPGARLHAVKVMGSTGIGNMADIISGVDWVAQHASTIEVANMSLGGKDNPSEALRAAITAAVNLGVVFVVAAGNDAFEVYGYDGVFGTTDDYYPASYPECMTVSALADSDGLPGGLGIDCYDGTTFRGKDDTLARFSNFGASAPTSLKVVSSPGGAIDVAAPGCEIYSTWIGSSYATLTGTSMACPHVAGAVALYVAQYGRATTAAGVYAIRQALVNCAELQSVWGRNPPNPQPIDHYPEGNLNVAHFGTVVNYPVVRMTYPQSASTLRTGPATSIVFAGSAIDAVDGDISANLTWTSSLSGLLGTGPRVTNTLSSGYQTITCSVTNSASLLGRDFCLADVAAPATTPPTVAITSPIDGGVAAPGALIAFTGTAMDTVDGNLQAKMAWTSSIDGPIGTGVFTRSLSGGAHVITMSAVNSGGLSASDQHSITVGGSPPPPPPTNYPPVVSISQPLGGASFPQGATIAFAGSASDAEDGDLSSSIRWADSVAGTFAAGMTTSTNGLVVGAHTVTASVQDSAGAVATASVAFSIYATNANTAPVVAITSPPNNTAGTVGVAQTFTGTSTDAEEGTLTNLIWNDSLEGVMGGGLSVTFTPTVGGTRTVTASSTDTNNATGSASIFWLVAIPPPPVTNTPPVVTITSPANGTVGFGTVITCTASATDAEQGDLTAQLQWNDSLQGALGTGGQLQYTPIAGSHTLTAKVIDNGGLQGTATRTLTVTAPTYPLVVAVAVNPASVTNKQKETVTATVTANAVALAGATVQFQVKGASGTVQSSPSLATTSLGTASWKLQVNKTKLGAGVALVTATASKAGYNSGVGTNSFSIR